MWLITAHGFYSVVAHRDEPDRVLVRARSRTDLQSLCNLAEGVLDDVASSGFSAAEIIELDDADYRYRLIVQLDSWTRVATALAEEIDYPNFKDAVARREPARAHLYMEVWGTLRQVSAER